jgi:hypothetical protein
MGAVNRCWKCGLDLRAATQPHTPPTSMNAAEPLIVAELAPERTAAETEQASAPEQVSTQSTMPAPKSYAPAPGQIVGYTPEGITIRKGSPFAAGSLLLPPQPAPQYGAAAKKKKPPGLQQAYASGGGAVAAMVLGIFGVIIAPFRFEGAIVGTLGLVMGIWGLYSPRRGWALFGLILCCLAIGLGMYTGALWLFRSINNATPWEY